MRKVKELKILGKTYKVVWTDDGSDFLDGKWGKIVYGTLTMYIDGSVADEQAIDSFFHEVFHAFNRELGLELKENDIERLGTAMCDFIINNSDKMVFTR